MEKFAAELLVVNPFNIKKVLLALVLSFLGHVVVVILEGDGHPSQHVKKLGLATCYLPLQSHFLAIHL
jgi:hypothetical protein